MMRSVRCVLFLVMFVLTASCAYGYMVFQDNFDGISGADPSWDVLSGTFEGNGVFFVPGNGTAIWTENLAAPKGLYVDHYTMTARVLTDSSTQDLWSIRPHQKDSSNYLRLCVNMSTSVPSMYWQAVVAGVDGFGGNAPVPVFFSSGLGGTVNVRVTVDSTGVSAILGDGTHSYSITLPDAQIPAALKGSSRIVLGKTTYGSASVVYDNVVIDNDQLPTPPNPGLARFHDEFSLPDGPDSKWQVISGSFLVQSGKFVPGLTHGTTDMALAVEGSGTLLMDKYVMSFWLGSGSGIADNCGVYIHRKDANNFVRLWFANNQMCWQTRIAGTWFGPLYAVSIADLNRASLNVQVGVEGNGIYAIVSDGVASRQTYLTAANYASLTGVGSAICFEANEWAGGTRFDDVTIDDPPLVSIGAAKQLAGAGWYGRVQGFVTAVFKDYNKFVIESGDRSAAITIAPITGSPQIGQELNIQGFIQADGTLSPEICTPTGNQNALQPLGMKNHDLAGADSSPALSSMDILAKTWGRVLATPAPFATPGYNSTTFYITDGSATGKSTAQVIGGPWTQTFQDSFNFGRNSLWGDYGTAPQVKNSALVYSANCISWVSQYHLQDEIITADVVGGTTGSVGLVCRFVNVSNCLVAIWLQSQNRICFYEVISGNWGLPLGDLYCAAPLVLPVHLTAEVRDYTAKFTVSDGNTFYSTSTMLTRWPDPQLVGLYHDLTTNNSIDNYKVYASAAPMTVDGDIVQVTIPGSVTGAPTVNPGDYVAVTGIVSRGPTLLGSTLTAALRGITIRTAGDLSK